MYIVYYVFIKVLIIINLINWRISINSIFSHEFHQFSRIIICNDLNINHLIISEIRD
jgi:hypothetical protein